MERKMVEINRVANGYTASLEEGESSAAIPGDYVFTTLNDMIAFLISVFNEEDDE